MNAADLSTAELAEAEDPEVLMDRVYRRQRHIYDLTRKYFLLGRDSLIEWLDPPPGGSILEIGCGTGRNLIAAARAYPDATLYGIDISTAMLKTAHANLRVAGLEHRISLGAGDAATFDSWALFGRIAFDRVFFSYSLSMIPAWRDALKQAAGLIEPAGGRLLTVDFGEQSELPRWFGEALRRWLACFHVSPRAEIAEVLAALALANGGRLTAASLYRDYARFTQLTR
jgi:S-adenosylmethionine-diacylgycerolhomoserine-N-methlytransferase